MKKILILVLVLFIVFSFGACGESSNSYFELDFRSILDTETGAIFTLGDPLSVFVEVLGEGEEVDSPWLFMPESTATWEVFHFFPYLSVSLVNDRAYNIQAYSDRFAFVDMDFDMTPYDLDDYFVETSTIPSSRAYTRSIDANGNSTLERDSSEYTQHISFSSTYHVRSLVISWRGELHRNLFN